MQHACMIVSCKNGRADDDGRWREKLRKDRDESDPGGLDCFQEYLSLRVCLWGDWVAVWCLVVCKSRAAAATEEEEEE